VAAKVSYNGLDFFTMLLHCVAFSAVVKSHLCLLIPSKTVLTCEHLGLTVIARDRLNGRTRSN